MINDNPFKITKLQIKSSISNNQEIGQKFINNSENKQFSKALSNISQIRCHSENFRLQQKKLCTSNTEQFNLTQQNAELSIICNNSTRNMNMEDQQTKTQQNKFNSTSQEINDSQKRNNKRVVLSALRIKTEIAKQIEEQIDTIDCESILNEELKKYRRLRTDSIVENSHVKQQFLQESHSLNLQNQKIKSSSINLIKESNKSFNKDLIITQSFINIQEEKKQNQIQQILGQDLNNQVKNKNGEEAIKIEKECIYSKEKASIQKAFENLEEEINSLNANCRKRHCINKKILAQRKNKSPKQNIKQNTIFLSSDEDIEPQSQENNNNKSKSSSLNYELGMKDAVQEKQSSYCEYQFNINTECNNNEDLINIQRIKIYNAEEKKQNQNKKNPVIKSNKKLFNGQTSSNFTIFKNSYLQKMQSEQTTKNDSSKLDFTSFMNDDTSSSKISSDLSTQKNSYVSDETFNQNSQSIIQLLLPNESQINKSTSSEFQKIKQQSELSPNGQTSFYQHNNYLDKSCDNFLNKTNSNQDFNQLSFGANGFLNPNMTVYSSNNQQQNYVKNISIGKSGCSKKIRSITPSVISSFNQQKYQNNNSQITKNTNESFEQNIINFSQPQQVLQQQNKTNILDNTFIYQSSSVLINNKNSNQRQSLNSSSLKKRDKSQTFLDQEDRKNQLTQNNLNKTLHTQKINLENNNQSIKNEIGSINCFRQKLITKVVNDIFASKQSQKESEIGDNKNNTFQIRKINHQKLKSDQLNHSIQQAATSSVVHSNNDIAQQNTTNLTSNQDKQNTLLIKKNKYLASKMNNSNILKEQLESQNRIYTEENDLNNSFNNMIYSPTSALNYRTEPNHLICTENQYLKV